MPASGAGKLVGIDLGTTYSVVASLDSGGQVSALSNKDGAPLTPSVVYLDGSTALVGEAARKAAAFDASKVAAFVKRDMGKSIYSKSVDGRHFRPETLSAIILRKLKKDAERRIGHIAKAVITVPAFFDDTRRKATQDAGRIAGLDVLDIINEPTAAALAYAMEGTDHKIGAGGGLQVPGGQMTALVYDLGGGTFDVTVVRLSARRFETLATDGAIELGGKDWDDKIVYYVAEEFRKRHGFDPLQSADRDEATRRQARDALAAAAEETKKLLSSLPGAPIRFNDSGRELALQLTRSQFEELSQDKLAETRIVTELVVKKQAKLSWEQIDRVLLVGGSTRMPMVKKMLRAVAGRDPDDSLDPDQVVARGAAIHAGTMVAKAQYSQLELDDDVREELQDVNIVNVNAYSLGVEVMREGREISAVMIPKNTQLPVAKSRIFRTREAGAQGFLVKVLEGEAVDAAHNIHIGECLVKGLPSKLPARSPVQVRLSYGVNGRIEVLALDMTTGHKAQVEIQRESGLSEADIRREKAFVESLDIQ